MPLLTPRLRRLRNLGTLAGVSFVTGVIVADTRRKTLYVNPTRRRWKLQMNASPAQPGEVVFIGDSNVRFFEWRSLFPDMRVRNFGIQGDKARDVLDRLGDAVDDHPAAIVIMIGTNDVAGFAVALRASIDAGERDLQLLLGVGLGSYKPIRLR